MVSLLSTAQLEPQFSWVLSLNRVLALTLMGFIFSLYGHRLLDISARMFNAHLKIRAPNTELMLTVLKSASAVMCPRSLMENLSFSCVNEIFNTLALSHLHMFSQKYFCFFLQNIYDIRPLFTNYLIVTLTNCLFFYIKTPIFPFKYAQLPTL